MKRKLLSFIPVLLLLGSCAGGVNNSNVQLFQEDNLAHEEIFGSVEEAVGKKRNNLVDEDGYHIFDRTSNLIDRFEESARGVIWVDRYSDTTAHLRITQTDEDAFRGGMFINTGVEVTEYKEYNVHFTISRKEDRYFKVQLFNSQFDGAKLKEFEVPNGTINDTFTVDKGEGGTVWVFVESGNNINEFTLSDLSIGTSGTIKFRKENMFDRFDGTAGNIWIDEFDNKKAHLEVSTKGAEIWRGGMFINTGIEMVSGKAYKVSYHIERAYERDFKVTLQYKQWDVDVEHEYGNSSNIGDVEMTVEPNNDTAGWLWIYVASGTEINELTISNIKVEDLTPMVGVQYATVGDKTHVRFVAAITTTGPLDEDDAVWTRTMYYPNGEVFKETSHPFSRVLYTSLYAGNQQKYSIADTNYGFGTRYTYFVVYTMLNIPTETYKEYELEASIIISGTYESNAMRVPVKEKTPIA